MTVRLMSLSSGNGKFRALANSACENGLSPLMASSRAFRSLICDSTLTRSVSSGVQILPQS
jgi:hypothetical protein